MDNLVDFSVKSIAKFIGSNVPGIIGSYVITPDFDYNRSQSPDDFNKSIVRRTPYAGIKIIIDDSQPFSIGNILYNQEIQLSVGIFANSYSDMMQKTGSLKQALKSAKHPSTNEPGIQIFNYLAISGTYYEDAGLMKISIGQTVYFDPSDPHEQSNIKYRSYTNVTLDGFKDKDSVLLEGLGNVGFNDVDI